MASVAASDAATISASQEDKATLFCFLEPQEIAAWLKMKSCQTCPEVECLTTQSESDMPLCVPTCVPDGRLRRCRGGVNVWFTV